MLARILVGVYSSVNILVVTCRGFNWLWFRILCWLEYFVGVYSSVNVLVVTCKGVI